MKKKGLIISTVVMVVVLVASLTTATFAWFSTQATAAIEKLNVNTAASEGLQIALYDGTKSAYAELTGTFSSGTATLSETLWKGDADGIWGQTLSFSNDAAKYYGVSGNGLKMYTLDDTKSAKTNGKVDSSAKMKGATANSEYFEAYIALKNTENKTNDITISDISITLTGNAAQLVGINASLRVAVYAKTIGTEDQEEWAGFEWADTDLKLVYVPYSKIMFKDGTWKDDAESTDMYTNTTIKYLKEQEAYDNTYGKLTAQAFASDKVIVDTASKATKDKTGLPAITADKTIATNKIAESIAKDGIVYLRVVIWYEGEDPECITTFAGGGATIAMNFTQSEHAGA